MTLAIMQPYLFPYIGYWQLISAVDTFVIYDDVNFIKKGYINRNNILFDDKAKSFTLELQAASQNKLINQISVGNNRKKLIKTIEITYKKAPHFNEVFPLIKKILDNNEENLAKFVGDSLEIVSSYLLLKTKFVYSSNINKDNSLKGEDKILAMSKILNANYYINAIGGQDLYDKDSFKKEGIDLHFLSTEIVEYQQFKNDFVPYLSIIDMMMFNNIEEIQIMIKRYTLI